MLADLSRWDCGPIDGRTRVIAGKTITFKYLPLRQRYDLGVELAGALGNKTITADTFLQPKMLDMAFRLVDLSDADEDFLDDLTVQIPLALTALEINVGELFDAPARMQLHGSRHKAVVKILRKEPHADAAKIAPTIQRYWFLYRPVYADICTYAEMFLDERFSFAEIHLMHELLDLKQFNDIVATTQED